jgi:hypothetical protein
VKIHRDLKSFPLADALATQARVMTMSVGQWDAILAAAYERGWILLELDAHEEPVRAYRTGLQIGEENRPRDRDGT